MEPFALCVSAPLRFAFHGYQQCGIVVGCVTLPVQLNSFTFPA